MFLQTWTCLQIEKNVPHDGKVTVCDEERGTDRDVESGVCEMETVEETSGESEGSVSVCAEVLAICGVPETVWEVLGIF